MCIQEKKKKPKLWPFTACIPTSCHNCFHVSQCGIHHFPLNILVHINEWKGNCRNINKTTKLSNFLDSLYCVCFIQYFSPTCFSYACNPCHFPIITHMTSFENLLFSVWKQTYFKKKNNYDIYFSHCLQVMDSL